MSNVKLHIPFYTESILLKALQLMTDYDNLVTINTKDFYNKDKKKMYKNICKFIFDNEDTLIIIFGDFDKYALPISVHSGILIKNITTKRQRDKYPRYYTFTEKEMCRNMYGKICNSTSSSTFGFNINKKMFVGDVFHLFYLTNFNKPKKMSLEKIIRSAYIGDKDLSTFETIKLWDNTTVKTLKKYPEHMERIKLADLSYPIILFKTKNKLRLCDGLHRIIKSYLNNLKTIKVIIATEKQLQQTKLSPPNYCAKGVKTKCIKRKQISHN